MPRTETYNGWTNYATWRVNLEVFDGFDTDGTTYTDAMCRDHVEEFIDMTLGDGGTAGLLSGWLNAFLSDVDWGEIAKAVNEANGTEEDDEEEDDDAR
jgi:hypothetical protein